MNWYKIVALILFSVFVYEASLFLNRVTWIYAYSERGECLESIYSRGNDDWFDSHRNCFDIISKLVDY